MKCSMCRVNTAIVFVTKMENGIAKREGLCIPCAQKQGLAPLDAILQQTGMSQEEFDNISEQMTDIFEDVDMDQLTESFTKPDEHGKNHISNLFNSAFAKNNKDEDMTFKQAEKETQDGSVKTKVKKANSPKRKNLDAYGINLNEKALNHEVDRIIGRHREIDRVIQILNRRTKTTQCLLVNRVWVRQL